MTSLKNTLPGYEQETSLLQASRGSEWEVWTSSNSFIHLLERKGWEPDIIQESYARFTLLPKAISFRKVGSGKNERGLRLASYRKKQGVEGEISATLCGRVSRGYWDVLVGYSSIKNTLIKKGYVPVEESEIEARFTLPIPAVSIRSKSIVINPYVSKNTHSFVKASIK